jgi:uncharacterized protein (TIGR03000 family)
MTRYTKHLGILGLVALAALLTVGSQADAWWGGGGWGCGSSCYSGCGSSCYSSCYSPCYSSCYSSCNSCYSGCGQWTVGPRRGPARRCLFGPYRSYYTPSYSCCTSSCGWCGTCCDTGCCDSCDTDCCTGCDSGCTDANGSACQPSDTPTEAAPKPDKQSAFPTPENSGQLTIWVPAKTKVIVNGHVTKTDGTRRRYVSYNLKPGMTYKYEIRAEFPKDGKLLVEKKTVYLTAGANDGVAFGFNVDPYSSVAAAQ